MATSMEQTFNLLIRVELAYALFAFVSCFLIIAPYGRHARAGWGPTISARRAWILQELPAFAVIIGFYLYYRGYTNVTATVFLLIWQAHYVHRTFIYPNQMSGGAKPYPLLIALFGVAFNAMNGILHGIELFSLRQYPLNWLWSPQFLVGVAIFIAGYRINKKSDATLRRLRSNGKGYQVPHGGLYERISCPNYFGEILEWLGWAILTWSVAGFAFFLFTVANLLPRAISHHRWYRDTFDNYPRNRRALIPFLL
jgi:protein-S-isoprenylcysteine O-methyltransferase Ste14